LGRPLSVGIGSGAAVSVSDFLLLFSV